METSELNKILDQHRLWLNGKGGKRADLRDTNLYCASLWGASLVGADLTGADLNGANLTGANLTGANLTRANLRDANLTRANLTGTILENKAEKKAEIASVNAESSIRSEIEAIAKKHGMKVDSMTFSLI